MGYAWNINRSQLTRTSVISIAVVAPVAPFITAQPAAVSPTVGQTVTLNVVAGGTPTPTYQWRFNNGVIPGATSATLTLNNVQTANTGSYEVVVSNSAGAVTSAAATVTVNAPVSQTPTVTLTPSATSVLVGQTVNFTVAGNCPGGLSEIGLEGCNSSGQATVNLGGVGASGSAASYVFPWSPTVAGTYYFVSYAWNATRLELTRSGVIAVTVTAPVSEPPTVTLTPTVTSPQVGQVIGFTVAANCGSGLSEIGFEQSTAAGTPTQNLGGSPAGGVSDNRVFSWSATSAGTYYFVGYAWNADRSQLTRTTVVTVTVPQPPASTLQVTLSPSANSATVGQQLSFTVTGSHAGGLNELGLERCDAAGNPTANLGGVAASGGMASHTFFWSAPANGVYYFVGYAWNASRTQLKRTGVVTVTVGTPASSVPQVTLTPSATSVPFGQAISFTVGGTCASGLAEIGLEQTDAAGNSPVNRGLVSASGSSAAQTFSWSAPAAGTYHFLAYAWNANRSNRTRGTVVTVTAITEPAPFSITTSGSPTGGSSYEVYANNVQGTTRVVFPTWTENNGQDDIEWIEGEYDALNNRWKGVVRRSQHNQEAGSYMTHVYATGTDGASTLVGYVTVLLTPQLPSVTNSGSPTSSSLYEVYANNVQGASRVEFPTWTEANGQDDIRWIEGQYDAVNNRWKAVVRRSEHNNEYGTYITHVYVTVGNDSAVFMDSTTVTMTPPPPPSVTSSANPTNGVSYEVYANNVQGATRVQFPTWTAAGGQDELEWLEGEYDALRDRWKATVVRSNHNYEAGSYVTHVYVTGDGGTVMLGDTVVTVTNVRPQTNSLTVSGVGAGERTFTGNATDVDGDLDWLFFYVTGPDLSGWNYIGSARVSGSNGTGSIAWTPPANKPGVYKVHLRAKDLSGEYDLNADIETSFAVGTSGSGPGTPTGPGNPTGPGTLPPATSGIDPRLIDTDGDGMTDAWEIDHGLNPQSAADAAADRNNDGISNLAEYNNSLTADATGSNDPALAVFTPNR